MLNLTIYLSPSRGYLDILESYYDFLHRDSWLLSIVPVDSDLSKLFVELINS